VRRREFFKGLAGAALVLPLAAHAQERTRRVAVLVTTPLGDPETQARIKAFLQGMQELGWTEGRNIRFDIRWDTSTVDGARKVTAELIALSPDVILAAGVTGLAAYRRGMTFRSYSQLRQIRSALGLSIVWLSLAAT
jgi:putative ABC transport system substrate-binding protein